jgi:uncharacterized protein YbjT (DUF2867 family)
MSKLIAVFGATGQQGGSVLRSLVKNGNYQLKAVTRSAKSTKAKQLESLKNVTIAEADLDDKESVDRALKDCYGAFLVTDFTAHFVKGREVAQGVNFIDKAIKNNVKHVVFSGLENVKSQINKPCLHFDYKADIEEYGLKNSNKINFTSIRMSMFYQELVGSMLNKAFGSRFLFNIAMDADKHVYAIDVDDIGNCATTVFGNPDKYKSKLLGIAGDYMKISEYTAALNNGLAPEIKVSFPGGSFNRFMFNNVLKFPGVEDIAIMFEYYNTEKFKRDLALTKELNPSVSKFSDWLVKNKSKVIADKKK